MDSVQASPETRPGTGAGLRRHVTVLFTEVWGSSEHAERLEAEEYAQLLDPFRRGAQDVIPRHGGSIARLQGDGLLALFGHLAPRDDDGRRATEAAVELHAAVAGLRVGSGADATSLALRSGIHAGPVLLVEGDIARGRVDVVGEVPNTAARLCSLAGGGEILVSAQTLGSQARFFQVSERRRVPIRGRSSALDVLHVLGRASVEPRTDASAPADAILFWGDGAGPSSR